MNSGMDGDGWGWGPIDEQWGDDGTVAASLVK